MQEAESILRKTFGFHPLAIDDALREAHIPKLDDWGQYLVLHSVLFLRRIIAPQREVLNKLAREDFKVVDEKAQVYYRDVYDHLVRMYDITEGVRNLVSGTLETYLSVATNRLNDIMKTLTLITTLFMPLSFVVSFFGMNFFLPERPISELMVKPVSCLFVFSWFLCLS
jgi:Mg2+ and Co2+ transporter CorA